MRHLGNRIRLRNRIRDFLNSKAVLDCKVEAGPISGVVAASRRNVKKYFERLVTGTAKNGRTIVIYPLVSKDDSVPRAICDHMKEIETRGGIVGTAKSIGDAFCIVVDSQEYPRFNHTFLHHYWLRRWEERDGRATDK